MLLCAKHLSKSYRNGDASEIAVDDVCLELEANDFLVVTGVSGSGKSTLLHLLSGLETPTSGTVEYRGHDIAGYDDRALSRLRNSDFGFIFQTPHLLTEKSVLENVALPCLYGKTISAADARRRAQQALKQVDMLHLADRFPGKLSGGEMQRAVFARALIREPQVLFADEPTGSLDADNSEKILELLLTQAKEHRCVVLATHDPALMHAGTSSLHLTKAPAGR